MDKELLEQILPIVEKTKEGVLKSTEILYQQLPDVVNQIYFWYTFEYFGWLFFSLISGVMGWILIKRFALEVKQGQDFFYGNPILLFSGVPLGIFGLIGIPYNIICLLQIWVAPKVFLIKLISQLLNK